MMMFPSELKEFVDRLMEILRVDVDELMSRKRTKNVALCRQISIWYAKKKIKMSHEEIGKLFNRDQSLVTYIEKQIDGFIDVDPSVREIIEQAGVKL